MKYNETDVKVIRGALCGVYILLLASIPLAVIWGLVTADEEVEDVTMPCLCAPCDPCTRHHDPYAFCDLIEQEQNRLATQYWEWSCAERGGGE